MSIEDRFEMIRKNGREIPRPMELYGEMDEKSALAHLDAKASVFADGALSVKFKFLAALSAAVALDSGACILNNVKAAKMNGATKEEILETIAVAKFSKSATIVSSAAPALEWLSAQENT